VAVKRGLGKGLSALLPTEDGEAGTNATGINAGEESPNETGVAAVGTKPGGEIMVSPEKLIPNPNQPRKDFDAEKLAELAETIRLQGIIQPVVVEDAGDGSYIIVDGERRVRAARIAGLAEVPVILRQYSSDERRVEVSLTANIQRSDLNPIEEAAAYRQLMEMEGLGQDEVAAKVGKNRATVANALRLLKLPREMQESIQKAELSPGHARAVLSVSAPKMQEALFSEIIRKGLSVREAEKRAAAFGKQKKAKKESEKAQGRPPELASMEEKFITRLGTKVVINGDLTKGTILIDYYSMEDLERLYEIIDKK
jgi:ParB family chromosome partitioning protein